MNAAPSGRFSAQKSTDGKTLVVRYVNNGAAQTLKLTIKGTAAELAAYEKAQALAEGQAGQTRLSMARQRRARN